MTLFQPNKERKKFSLCLRCRKELFSSFVLVSWLESFLLLRCLNLTAVVKIKKSISKQIFAVLLLLHYIMYVKHCVYKNMLLSLPSMQCIPFKQNLIKNMFQTATQIFGLVEHFKK